MPSLSEAMERASADLYRFGDSVDEVLSVLTRQMPNQRIAQPYDAFLKGFVWLFCIVWIDRWAGHPSVLQLLYLVPVWLAFETASLGVAACLAAATIPISTIASPTAPWGIVWDLVVRAGMMFSLVAIMTWHGRRYRVSCETAHRDALTGCLNRAGFESQARAQIDESLTQAVPLTVAVIDCDNFKELNDLKGHAFGDQILRTLVRTITTTVEGATLGRTGGDEFVLIDRRRSPDELRRALAFALDRYNDATLVMGRRASFTVGIAQLGSDGMRYESLLESADRDMYRGKTARFQTMVA